MNCTSWTIYAIGLFLGAGGAWVIHRWGPRLSLLDKPGARSSHRIPTPKGGGIGILATLGFVSLAFSLPVYFWLPGVLVSLLSLAGDRFDIPPFIRLPFHFLAALLFLLGGGRFSPLSLPGLAALAFLLVFMVGTANFYNFMDGIDGIAGITGMLAFALLGFFGSARGIDPAYWTLAFALSLSCLGFLFLNLPKAKVFMGDVGSILLGFVFSQMVVKFSRDISDFLLLAAFLFPFYADELTTMAVRLRGRENLFRAHRRHIYQLLANQGGIPHWKVSAGFGLCQLAVGTSLLLSQRLGPAALAFLLGVWLGASIMASITIRERLEGSNRSIAG